MSVSDDLLARFLEDRESLSETEFDALLAALKADAALSKALKDLLVIDGLCAQTLAPDRRGFKAQVAQRLRDLERGHALEAGDVVKRFHARPAPRHLARWVALASAACTVLVVTLWMAAQPSSPGSDQREAARLTSAAQGVTLRRGSSELPAGSAAPVLSGDTLVNPTESPAELALQGEDSRITLKPDSSLTLTRGEDGSRVELLRGALHARLAPQDPRHPVRFVTPYGEAQVIGTELNLELRASDARLEVLHGTVRVVRKEDGESVLVEAGQAANVGPGRELVALALAGPAPSETEASTDGVPPGYTASPWRSIFDGKTLNGWQQDKGRWSVEDGALVATTEKSLEQAALMHSEILADFELRFSYFVEGNGYLEFRDRVSDLGSFQYSAREKNHTQWRACRIRIVGRAGSAEIDGTPVPYEAAGDISQPGKIRFYVQNRGSGIVTRLRVKDVDVRTFSKNPAQP